jgi:hypothetical protein
LLIVGGVVGVFRILMMGPIEVPWNPRVDELDCVWVVEVETE